MKKHYKHWLKIASGTALLTVSIAASAAEPEQCKTVTFTDPGWSDIGATNAIATTLLTALGYKTHIMLLGVPIVFESLKTGEADVFLGNWMPVQKNYIKKYADDINVIRTNLTGIKFTLAVPTYVYDDGVKDFADLHKFSNKFHHRIYGIEAGSAVNQTLQKMIHNKDYDLGDWQLVASSEQGMLAQVARFVKRHKFIVFIAWEPHPMNIRFHLKYLSGGDKYFGPNYGGNTTVQTITRKGYTKECGNVGKFLHNLKFNVKMENEIMLAEKDEGKSGGGGGRGGPS